MSVPLERLYTHLNNLCNHDIVISHWFPHGSKKASDLKLLKGHVSTAPTEQFGVICHDQEPLNFDFYQYEDLVDGLRSKGFNCDTDLFNNPEFKSTIEKFHLRCLILHPLNRYDQTILVHSELSSPEAQKYRDHDFIPVYWWAHGAISQDWFRYAKHDKQVMCYSNNFNKTFLVYSRGWTGTRRYRLEFLKSIKAHDLYQHSMINFSGWDDGKHYSDIIDDSSFEQYFSPNTASSSASADYTSEDYQQCAIELVLETIYESSRIHLTEKTCRPLACGKPFILAAGPGSLKILRDYGFETFEPWIDESYDSQTDCDLRREMIIQEMQRLCDLPKGSSIWAELHQIANRNRQRFFSREFTDQLFEEFATNFAHATQQLTTSGKYAALAKEYLGNNSNDGGTIRTLPILKFYQ